MTQSSLHPINPFINQPFWGREREVQTIYGRLLSDQPQSVAIIGEPFTGKTALVRHLIDSQQEPERAILREEQQRTLVYLDCQRYQSYTKLAEMKNYAAAKFWWDLYAALQQSLRQYEAIPFPEPKVTTEQNALIETANEIKSSLEDQIRYHQHPIIFIMDNFEVIAHLPLYNSEWLRSLVTYNCAYIVTSRYLLYLLYQYDPQNMATPSPLWNIFSDPIYLGLMSENEVQGYLKLAAKLAAKSGSYWEADDAIFIKKIAGRHPELLRIACSRLFEHRLPADRSISTPDDELNDEFLSQQIYKDTNMICSQLWYGLTNPELDDRPGTPEQHDDASVRRYQKSLIEIAQGRTPRDTEVLFVLNQRGLIERVGGEWCVFSEAMRQFVLKQQAREQALLHAERTATAPTVHPSSDGERREDFTLTYMEGKVYEYLKAHNGQVCDREDIKRAIWGENEISNSALQKIIERLREKIVEDPQNAYELLAVRGRGYMLRMRSI